MKVKNTHSRELLCSRGEVAELLKTLATDNDQVWPYEDWMPIKFKGAVGVGAHGGHGPIKYKVSRYQPDEVISFTFTAPDWLQGYHEIQLSDQNNGCLIQHDLVARAGFAKYLVWLCIVRPLHNAIIEDCFTKVERSLGITAQVVAWSWWVKRLRKVRGYS